MIVQLPLNGLSRKLRGNVQLPLFCIGAETNQTPAEHAVCAEWQGCCYPWRSRVDLRRSVVARVLPLLVEYRVQLTKYIYDSCSELLALEMSSDRGEG